MGTENSNNIEINGELFQFIRPLTGRGQAAMAGFYQSASDKRTYLIKEDNPGTCLAEGTAIVYNPTKEQRDSPIIQAQIAITEKNGQPISISIQEAFTVKDEEGIKPFDAVLLGHKRAPKTWISEEWRASSTIKEKIGQLTTDVKEQLAYAIYTSQLNGDESLHTGQFMVAENKDTGELTSIKRIDFGALGRYGLARKDFDPMHTSKEYAGSGQWGKDYVSFLLQDKFVADKVMELWRKTDPLEVADKIVERFMKQLDNITVPTIKKTALQQFSQSLLKNSTSVLPSDLHPDAMETQIILHVHAAALKRASGYSSAAKNALQMDTTLTKGNIDKFITYKEHYGEQLHKSTSIDTLDTASMTSETKSEEDQSPRPL
jgi:hypothetical protein